MISIGEYSASIIARKLFAKSHNDLYRDKAWFRKLTYNDMPKTFEVVNNDVFRYPLKLVYKTKNISPEKNSDYWYLGWNSSKEKAIFCLFKFAKKIQIED
jgi:hypothetical protein